jgi:type VI secretion system protein VasD
VWPATVVLLALMVAGCGTKPVQPTAVTGTVQASANVNPSAGRRPSPLLVRIYELKSVTAFNNADFVSLYQRDQAELGAEMVGREEIILNPGDSRPISQLSGAETRFVGVFAAYRDLDNAQWRGVLAIQPGQKQRILINAEELSISAVVVK